MQVRPPPLNLRSIWAYAGTSNDSPNQSSPISLVLKARVCLFARLKQARKGFWPLSAIFVIIFWGIFWNFFGNFSVGVFWEKFFGRIFLGGYCREDFYGRNFLGGFFWEEFSKKLFEYWRKWFVCQDLVLKERKEGRKKEGRKENLNL